MSSNHVALYRKYRPETFDDVVGQEHVVDLLQKALKSQKIGHAYLFCGGRGTGKTTVARILARELGSNPEDIIEIDAASNRGIDEIRELREAVRSMPFTSKYKVYIIDEAHMLTGPAANAFLKTLEEPPAHAIFILATTDPEKLPSTIVSRCQKVEFKQPDLKTLAERLVYVAKEEKKALALDAAMLLASHGKGSYRDALGSLEQVITRSEGKSISIEEVNDILGTPTHDLVVQLLEALCAKDMSKALTLLKEAEKESVDPNALYYELIEYIRIALLSRIGSPMLVQATSADVQKQLIAIGTTYPTIINSATLLQLLDNAKYLSVPRIGGYVGLETILLNIF